MSEQEEDLREFAKQRLGVAISERPQIRLPGQNVEITDTATALFKVIAAEGGMFYRGEKVVTLEEQRDDSLPVLEVLKPARARSVFEKYATFMGVRNEKAVSLPMSKDTADAMLESSVAKQVLPNVSGLINTPLLILHQGDVHLLEPGYDHRTGLFVTGKRIIEPATVEEAVGYIETSLTDYDFQSDGDISRAIAAIITPGLKFGGFLKGTIPVEIIEANESQTGKGYLTLRRDAIYGEIPTNISQQRGGVGSTDEKFASALVKGRPFILLDNWKGRLDSSFVESFITAQGNFSVRIPHAGESYIDPSRFCITITSNGIETTEDLANRASFIRLVKNAEQTVQEFGGKRMLETIRGAQPYFLGAVTKVIRHWFEQGMPKTAETRHSFAPWVQSLDWIVQNIFSKAPLLEGMADAQERIQSPYLSFLRLVAIQVEKQGKLNLPLTTTEVAEICEQSNTEIPGFKATYSTNENAPMQRIGIVMKAAFDDKDEIVVERFRVTRTEQYAKNPGGNPVLTKYYQFRVVGSDSNRDTVGPSKSDDESLLQD